MKIRPLTLILGYNGSGKTELIRNFISTSPIGCHWCGYDHPHRGNWVPQDVSDWMRDHCEVEIKWHRVGETGYEDKTEFVYPDGRRDPVYTGNSFSFLLSVVSLLHVNSYLEKDTVGDTVIQEPENRLHRKLQSEVGELIPRMVSKYRNLIIETNSEEILIHTRLAVSRGILNRGDVAIYWVENQIPSLIELNDDGSWNGPWPPWV